MALLRHQLCFLFIFQLYDVVAPFFYVYPTQKRQFRKIVATTVSLRENVDVNKSERNRVEGSKVLESIVGQSSEDFFRDTWQKSSRIYRSQLKLSLLERQHRWDDARVDEDPFHELVHMGMGGIVSLLSEARGCLDNPVGDWRMLLPLVYRSRQMLQLPEVRGDYGNSLFAAYVDGCSVVLNHADELCPYIASACLDLQKSFPHAYANAYLTPPASQAVPAHADDRDVFVIQLYGQKHWRVYENIPIPYPYQHEQVGKNGLPIPEEVLNGPLSVDSILRPGDVLYIPRGEVHEAHTYASEPSFHVTIALPTFDWALTGILTSAVRHTLDGEREYRMAVPTSFGMQDFDSIPGHEVDALEKQVEDALELVKRQITAEAISHNLRRKHELHNDRALPKRLARISQARAGAGADANVDKSNVVGKAAADTVMLNTYVRASTPEEMDLDPAASLPGIHVREEGMKDAMTRIMETLRTDPSHASCQVSKLPSLVDEECDFICDLTMLSYVRANVEVGKLAIVR